MQKVEERLAEIYGGGRWIAVNTVAASLPGTVDVLRAWGGEVMVVAASEGIGALPDVPIAYTGTSGKSALDGIRRLLAAVINPEDELLAAVDDFDPDRSARVILPPFGSDGTILRRDAYGARPPHWTALEDKIAALKIWKEAGIAVAPSRVVSVSQAAGAADELASHLGTVWVADNSQGWHGGAEYVRWVPGPEDYQEAAMWFEGRAREVRVMPFLDGLPCSIHGWVDDSTTAVFRPVEILILRTPGPGFKYAGVSTRWDPPADLRAEMRSTAAAVGEVLRERVGYRGPFGIDGIVTADGFLPTEFNARLTGGFGAQTAGLDLPLGMVVRAVIAGDLDFDASELEGPVVEAADADRSLRAWIEIAAEYPKAKTGIRYDDGVASAVTPEEGPAMGTIEVGPTASGSVVFLRLEQDEVGVGEPMAPLATEAARLAVDLWGIDLPSLTPAPDVTG